MIRLGAEILDIFIKSMGEGFPEVLFNNTENKRGENSNNFKQKLSKMKNGDEKAFWEIYGKLDETIVQFCEFDDKEFFSESGGSDKYFTFTFKIWPIFSGIINTLLHTERYENIGGQKENLIAYILTENFVARLKDICSEKNNENSLQEKEIYVKQYYDSISQLDKNTESYKEKHEEFNNWKAWLHRSFRPEYDNSFLEVLKRAKTNKTFYKWPIDELKKTTAKEQYNFVIEETFGNYNIEKLKSESGARRWNSFEKIFKNEQKTQLGKEIEKMNVLPKYEVFQSRMLYAFFLENLRAVLPNYVGKENAEKMWTFFYSTIENKKLENLEKTFNVSIFAQKEQAEN